MALWRLNINGFKDKNVGQNVMERSWVDEAVPMGAGPAFGAGGPCWVWGLLGVPRLRGGMRIPSEDAERR